MKNVTTILALFIGLSINAQNYTISPSSTLTVNAPFGTMSIFDIYQNNTANFPIYLEWELVSQNIPSNWDFALCDLGHCYPGIPASGVMDSCPPASPGFLGLNIDPYNNPGSAVVKIYVYEKGFKAQGDTCTWIVTAGPNGINDLANQISMSFYPNPVTDNLIVQSFIAIDEPLKLNIYNALGQQVYISNLVELTSKIDVTAFPNGVYLAYIINEKNDIIKTEKLIIKHK